MSTDPQARSAESCPICQSPTVAHCEKEGHSRQWQIRRCTACGHGYVANRPTYDELAELYETDPSAREASDDPAQERRADCRSLVRRVAGLTALRGASLDVGSGSGAFSMNLAAAGFRPCLIDLDPRAEESARRVPGAEFVRCGFEQFESPKPFSAIVMSQVLEHALDPIGWVRRASELLEVGGVLAVALPNFAGVYRLLGRRDPFLIPPVHLNYFTARSLRSAFAFAGLRPVRLESHSEISLGGGFVKRRLVAGAWNAVSRILNPTRFGIILRGYAIKVGRSENSQSQRGDALSHGGVGRTE